MVVCGDGSSWGSEVMASGLPRAPIRRPLPPLPLLAALRPRIGPRATARPSDVVAIAVVSTLPWHRGEPCLGPAREGARTCTRWASLPGERSIFRSREGRPPVKGGEIRSRNGRPPVKGGENRSRDGRPPVKDGEIRSRALGTAFDLEAAIVTAPVGESWRSPPARPRRRPRCTWRACCRAHVEEVLARIGHGGARGGAGCGLGEDRRAGGGCRGPNGPRTPRCAGPTSIR
jgi:hypothetical protein